MDASLKVLYLAKFAPSSSNTNIPYPSLLPAHTSALQDNNCITMQPREREGTQHSHALLPLRGAQQQLASG